MRKILTLLIGLAMCLYSSPGFASPLYAGYSEDWNDSADLAGWQGSGISNVAVIDAGGNPGGYLLTYGNAGGSSDIGVLNRTSPALTGNYVGHIWNVSFDMSPLTDYSNIDNAWLRFWGSANTPYTAWNYKLAGTVPGGWKTYSVSFNPNWSDAQARAAGWFQDMVPPAGGAAESVLNPARNWNRAMSNVSYTEIRISGEGNILAGIDNFKLAPVPEPATIFLLGGGLAGLFWRRRKASKA